MFNSFFPKYKLFWFGLIFLAAIFSAVSFTGAARFSLKDNAAYKSQTSQTDYISIGHKKLKLLLAFTEQERKLGLSGRERLSPDEAMLFVFDSSAIYPFWMRDMKFSIDIFWIDDAGEVVFIKENANPASYPDSFVPDAPARFVLETNSGFAKKNDVKIGDKIYFSRAPPN